MGNAFWSVLIPEMLFVGTLQVKTWTTIKAEAGKFLWNIQMWNKDTKDKNEMIL